METTETEWVEEAESGPEAGEDAGEVKTRQETLTPKMLEVMTAMSEYGYLTMAEVQLIYGNRTWSYRRVKALREQGLVADFDTHMSPRAGHHLTPRGYRVLARAGLLKTGWRFHPERYTTFSFRHRMACAKVGLLLERHPLVRDFRSEIRLWKYRRRPTEKICDGEFRYQVPGRERSDRVGLEVELTLKNKTKLEESFEQLGRRDLDQVWWVCGDQTVLRSMHREVVDRCLIGPQRHYFVLLDDFLAAKGRGELMEAGGRLLSIDPEKPTLPTSEPERPPPPEETPPRSDADAPSAAPAIDPAWKIYIPNDPELLRPPVRPAWERRSLWSRLAGAWEERRRLWDWGAGALALIVAAWLLSLGAQLAAVKAGRFRPDSPLARRSWQTLRPNVAFWKLGAFRLLIPYALVRGREFRLKIALERLSADEGGCLLSGIIIRNARGRRLGRWRGPRQGIFGLETWVSPTMAFRAPDARRLTFDVVLTGVRSECGSWRVPVIFNR
ncbi:MAG: hypothetical protein KGM24_11435 [Elusimicrobia bacterium]|nr:hypothetical protein [Elusimicrobiota bacterium]